MNNKNCGICRDLLPLYHDGVCSDESRKFVEDHLKGCENCRKILNELDEDAAESSFRMDTADVLHRHRKKEKTAAVKAGMIIAGILLLPIIIMLIMVIPGYADLKTAFVLIAAMALVAGLTVVPLLSAGKKLSRAIIFSSLALLVLIFLVQKLFYGYPLSMYAMTACSVVFGISLPFFPVIVSQADLPGFWQKNKGLMITGWDTIWFYLMICSAALLYPDSRGLLFKISSFSAALAWVIFLTARYLKTSRLIKTGLIIIVCGFWASLGNSLGWVTIYRPGYDLHMEIMAVSLVLGAAFIIAGGVRTVLGRKRKADGKKHF